jgi:hypothetical protein
MLPLAINFFSQTQKEFDQKARKKTCQADGKKSRN